MNESPIPSNPEEYFKRAEDCWDRKEYARAIELYRKAALGGHQHSSWKLGEAYARAEGVDLDYAQAREWYIRATNGPVTWERVYAQLSVGVMYENGLGIELDYDAARKWYMGAYKDSRISQQSLSLLAFEALKRIEGK